MVLKTIAIAISGAMLVALSNCVKSPTFDKAKEEAKIVGKLMTAKSGADMAPFLDPQHTFIWDVVDHPRYGAEDAPRA